MIDTGIRFTHEEFGHIDGSPGSRARPGFSVFGDNNSSDCYGHGTHTAATAAGQCCCYCSEIDSVHSQPSVQFAVATAVGCIVLTVLIVLLHSVPLLALLFFKLPVSCVQASLLVDSAPLLVSGLTYGVAKNATLISVRALDCTGQASYSDVIMVSTKHKSFCLSSALVIDTALYDYQAIPGSAALPY